MTLVNDPARGDATFGGHPPALRPRVFVEDPGARADALGLNGIAAGDSLWHFNDDIARFRGLYVDSAATFASGCFARYAPGARSNFCFVYGGDRSGGCTTGRTACRGLTLLPTEAAELASLAEAVDAYATRNGLRLGRSRRYYEGGPYWMHVIRCRLGAWWTRTKKDGTSLYATARLPVHEQCFHALLNELAGLPPISIEIARDNGRLVYRHTRNGEAAALLETAMAPYQVGAASWFMRRLRRLTRAGHCSIRYPKPMGGEMTATFEPRGSESVRCTTAFE